jgi:hypothetical protein
MKKFNYLCVALGVLLLSPEIAAQTKGANQSDSTLLPADKIKAESDFGDPFDKKFRVGLSWNQYWGTIKGSDLRHEYFWKPNVGFNIRAEYYPIDFLGVAVGWGVQMRGAGIINEDKYGGTFVHPWDGDQGDTQDSTYRQRLRFNEWEIPIALCLRTPHDVIKGIRLSASMGIVIQHGWYTRDYWHKVEDGFQTITNVTDDYVTDDLSFQFTLGADINCAGSSLFQVHLLYSQGTENVYVKAPGDGRLTNFGVRLSFLY